MKSRNGFLDSVKGMAIFLVVFAHCIQFGSGNEALLSDAHFHHWMFKLIYTFHMPVFMLVSGYLFWFSTQRHSAADIVKKRILHLLLPVFTWQTLCIICNLLLKTGSYHTWDSIFNSYLSVLWFLVSLFLNCLIVLILKPGINQATIWKTAPFLLMLFVPYHPTLCLFIFMFPFFLTGYLVNASGILNRIKMPRPARVSITIALVIVFIAMYLNYTYEHYIYTTGTFIVSHHQLSPERIYIVLFRWTIGFVGSALFLLLIKYMYAHLPSTSLLQYLGTNSLGIYIVSTYLFMLHSVAPQPRPGMLLYIVLSVIVTALSCAITAALGRNAVTKRLFLGG